MQTYKEALKRAVNLYGSRSPALATLYQDTAAAQLKAGDKDGAESSLNKAMAILEVSGSNSQMKAALLQLSDVVRQLGRAKEADDLQSRAASIKEANTSK